jgi:hypothetical protein
LEVVRLLYTKHLPKGGAQFIGHNYGTSTFF